MSKIWYAYIGGDPKDVSSYYRITVTHNCLCGDTICALYADKNEFLHPSSPLSDNIQLYIDNALATGQMQPQAPTLAKKYVYLKKP